MNPESEANQNDQSAESSPDYAELMRQAHEAVNLPDLKRAVDVHTAAGYNRETQDGKLIPQGEEGFALSNEVQARAGELQTTHALDQIDARERAKDQPKIEKYKAKDIKKAGRFGGDVEEAVHHDKQVATNSFLEGEDQDVVEQARRDQKKRKNST